MDVLQDPQGHLYVSTETGGINEVVSADLLADTLSFVRYNQQWGLPTDMMVSMALAGNKLLAVSNTQFMLIDTYAHTVESFGPHFFHETHRFSEARPLKLDNTRWLMPTQQGAFLLSEQLMRKSSYSPQLVLTGISIQNREQNLAVVSLDTLVLNPQERNLTIHFAALDYSDPHAVQYQFRLGDESTAWNNIGHDHSVTLLDLQPGTYRLTIRSTNADGLWVGNERSLLIIVQPRFVETTLARVLLLLLLLAVVAFSVYTYLYIRRIKRQRQETLQAYLELLNASAAHSEQRETSAASDPGASKWGVKEVDDNPFVRRLLDYVEQNLSDSDADIGQMAEACAVSRSVLQRKVKQLLGVTPIDFIREARMKHACHLLQTTDETIAEVAYHCGFSDPKYFSRCFKQSVGQSPSDYKAGLASS
jgi:AraC-like DNA-binding protein